MRDRRKGERRGTRTQPSGDDRQADETRREALKSGADDAVMEAPAEPARPERGAGGRFVSRGRRETPESSPPAGDPPATAPGFAPEVAEVDAAAAAAGAEEPLAAPPTSPGDLTR
ncbi:MAG TPA: hypothetical protein VFZ11_13440, partial [Gemmatimonadaceae bacterium]